MAMKNVILKAMLVAALLPYLSNVLSSAARNTPSGHRFVIENDLFLKNGVPFRIIGGDLHYFRVLPELWMDRLLRAKALGLNTIQTYVPWNLHEPRPGHLYFNGSADLLSFLKLAHDLDLLVMLRIGPYICGEWDLGGLPAWLLEERPAMKLRTSDARYLAKVDRWWDLLLPMIAPMLFSAGGPVIMVQIENEYGSFGSDKVYLQHLLDQARVHLRNDVIIYTTDGAAQENLNDGSLSEQGVFAAIDFPTGSDPVSAFALQKRFNPPGMSPPISTEFYTGWLTHWGERLAHTDAESTAEALDSVLRLNASVVLYRLPAILQRFIILSRLGRPSQFYNCRMVHGGTNFGFYSGANTGDHASDFQPDITSYDYDAPIGEAGDVNGAKFQAIRRVLRKYIVGTQLDPPPLPPRTAYGEVTMTTMGSLFDTLKFVSQPPNGINLDWPVPMEKLRQASGFILYRSTLPSNVRPGSKLSVVQVYDRAQVFVGSNTTTRVFVGTLERWSHNSLVFSAATALPGSQIDILVENMGRVNYGLFMGEHKGITEAVLVDEEPILGWTAFSIDVNKVAELKSTTLNPGLEMITSTVKPASSKRPLVDLVNGPVFYEGMLNIKQPSDTFMSLRGWVKGVAFVNGFNLGRFWPSMGPQCTLYIPGPLLHSGDNKLIILELESSSQVQTIYFMDKGDFSCGP